ncbi:hypothetical protein ACQ4LE_003949 [Meloidogyne hapla]
MILKIFLTVIVLITFIYECESFLCPRKVCKRSPRSSDDARKCWAPGFADDPPTLEFTCPLNYKCDIAGCNELVQSVQCPAKADAYCPKGYHCKNNQFCVQN